MTSNADAVAPPMEGTVPTLRAFNLGLLGSVVRINVGAVIQEKEKTENAAADDETPNGLDEAGTSKTSKTNGKKGSLPRPIIVLDRSGSMGQWVHRMVSEVCPTFLRLAGYADDDQVVLITFDSETDRVQISNRDPTVSELSKLKVSSRGSTQMAGSVQMLANILSEDAVDTHVLVLSDGEVHDKSDVLATAERLATTHEAPLSFSLVRLMTSSYGEPDTQALACMGSWSNVADSTPVIDITPPPEYSVDAFVDTVLETDGAQFFRGDIGNMVVLEAPGSVLRRTPLQDPVARMQLRVNNNSQMVMLLVDQGVESLTLDGVSYALKFDDAPSEHDLVPFLSAVENQMRMWAVMGSCADRMKKVAQWLTDLESLLTQPDLNADAPIGNSSKARAQRILIQVRHRQKQIIHRIKQLANEDMVANFNAAQQAAFLRQTDNTAGRRRLAKRAAQKDEELDFDALVRPCVSQIAQVKEMETSAQGKNDALSFYSLSGFSDIVEACEELEAEVDELTASEVLQCIGGIGVAFHARTGNFPDPWQFRVKDVFYGVNLAECDVWLHNVAAKDDSGGDDCFLQPPGMPGKNITGVCPLHEHPAATQVFRGPWKAIAELQAGLMLRRTLARIPYDIVARDTAVAWRILSALGVDAQLKEVEAVTLTHIVSNLYFGGVQELIQDMQLDDPRPWFTGDRDVSNVLKLVAVALKQKKPLTPALVRAMYGFDCYQGARGQFKSDSGTEDRIKAMCRLLGMDLSQHATPLKPMFEEEPENPEHYDTVTIPAEGLPSWVPAIANFVSLQRACLCFSEHPPKKHKEIAINPDCVSALCHSSPLSIESTFGVESGHWYQIATCATSLLTTCEADRVDKEARTMRIADPTSADECQSFLRTCVRNIIADDYAVRLRAKKADEAQQRMEQLQQLLCSCEDFDTFVSNLQRIPSRAAEGFNTLKDKMLDMARDIPLRAEKLRLMVTGRTVDAEPIWAQGNVLFGNLDAYAAAFRAMDKMDMWKRILEIKAEFGSYHYREGGNRNRHGHSNNFPSWWALQHESIFSYRDAVPENEWKEYLTKRCRKEGKKAKAEPIEPNRNPPEYTRLCRLMELVLDGKINASEKAEMRTLASTADEWCPRCVCRSRNKARQFARQALNGNPDIKSTRFMFAKKEDA
eukprot:GEMP01003684.1.p1 GENE.GEMP01003684.1~~GEMP01003684.1.p1  ORF type:complete len:1155 (+),score=327.23 GEMP01003684.1:76-3540(+)